jgi:chromosome segregation ATPase
LVEERDAAARQASDLTRELKSASARVELLTDHLGRRLRREEELRGLLQRAHERIERDDEELRSLAHQFQDDRGRLQDDLGRLRDVLRQQFEEREALEARLIRIRRSLPGRLFLTLRAISTRGRR